ncbi:unnamed protein product [Tetraodon nigroviridis]|uniref:Chromosome 5 SCAF14581, whole genome shotgun sequence n=1 Tax=Tetraodon nigroviridis TaxID=99883 RepID=Q4SHL3_TETNG|nr:unnamed protein product [Tetraodon nigroviridis]
MTYHRVTIQRKWLLVNPSESKFPVVSMPV